ncbi:hypothetical protein ASPTUDRAFT_199694 [Aspergillus tubingensis CBS 134.48]|uniref:Uncharacterized protein n=1 Tax=Aspergillus tubingensis (strain CBS 134.48) TaxID=767770 RepID=A0A1L9NDA8_ASPTC|nr:hypothetical protein ASPTUDRAFT_199694 [Aspergillus tubingensis CBS 134.48]
MPMTAVGIGRRLPNGVSDPAPAQLWLLLREDRSGVSNAIPANIGLHEAILRHMPLDHWLTGTQAKIDTATEGNYYAVNHFLNVSARYRRGLGLRAISFVLDAIFEVGYLHERSKIGEPLFRQGIRPVPENEGLHYELRPLLQPR